MMGDSRPNRAHIDQLDSDLQGMSLAERLRAIRAEIAGRLVLTTSFGLEDQVLTHEICANDLDVDIVTLDTGRLFPETYEVWARTEETYGRRIRGFVPDQAGLEDMVADQGINGFRNSVAARQACCHVRKVAPLRRALADASAWLTGLRADQSETRTAVRLAAIDEARGIVKVNPLLDWTRPRLADFVCDRAVPYNALHDRGFPSIGCAPCTRAVAPGEPERAGRWWWEREAHKECGLHQPATDGPAPRDGDDSPLPQST